MYVILGSASGLSIFDQVAIARFLRIFSQGETFLLFSVVTMNYIIS